MRNLYMSDNFKEAWDSLNENLPGIVLDGDGTENPNTSYDTLYALKNDIEKYIFSPRRGFVSRGDEAKFTRPYQQDFWAAAKKNEIDIKNFFIGFIYDIDDYFRISDFNPDGTFANKAIYGKIKDNLNKHPDNWGLKAFLKMWLLQFKDNGTITSTFNDLATEIATKRKTAFEAEETRKKEVELRRAEREKEERIKNTEKNKEIRANAEKLAKALRIDLARDIKQIIADRSDEFAKEVNTNIAQKKKELEQLAEDKDIDVKLLGTHGGVWREYNFPEYSILGKVDPNIVIRQLTKDEDEYRYEKNAEPFADDYKLTDNALITWGLPYEIYDHEKEELYKPAETKGKFTVKLHYDDSMSKEELKDILLKAFNEQEISYWTTLPKLLIENNDQQYNVVKNEIERQANINKKIKTAAEAQEKVNNGAARANDFESFIIKEIRDGKKAADAQYNSWSGSTDGSDGAAYAMVQYEVAQDLEPYLTNCNWKATVKGYKDETEEITYDISMGKKGFENLFPKAFNQTLIDFQVLPTSNDVF